MASAAVESDDEEDWQVVGSSFSTKKTRALEREAVASSGSGIIVHRAPDQATKSYHHLIGTAIRRDDGSRPEPEPDLSRDPQVKAKIGGILRLPPSHPVVSSHTTNDADAHPLVLSHTTNDASTLQLQEDKWDLQDTSEWPSVGWEVGTAPQLTSWNAVVKKQPPVRQSDPVDADTSGVEVAPQTTQKKKKKKKGKESSDVPRDPLTLELAAVFQALELTHSKKVVVATGGGVTLPKRPKVSGSTEGGGRPQQQGNVLDSSAPAIRRGKERETPKKKRPSALRKVITKEKEDRLKAQGKANGMTTSEQGSGDGVMEVIAHPERGLQTLTVTKRAPTIHNRRYREYCNHVITDEINQHVENLLSDLRHFQDRQYLKDPTKAKIKRRYVCGLKEVAKHLKLRKIKCVILPPNLDKIQSEGGINDFVGEIIALCAEQSVEVVFAMSRRRLAVLLHKKHQIGCVGIFFYDGAEKHYKLLMAAVSDARVQYSARVAVLTQQTSSKLATQTQQASFKVPALTEQPSSAAADLATSMVEKFCDSSDSESEDASEQLPFSLNVDASEFVPTCSHALNVNAIAFTPSFGELSF